MLKELIDQFYLDNQAEKGQTRFYITDAGKCPRAVFFKFKQAPKEKMDPRILRVYETGEVLHRNIYNILYRLKIGLTTEIPIPPQEIVSGRADAILCINGENYVLDIKSINSMIFRGLSSPKPEHMGQVQLYMHFFNIKKGIILYLDKDKQDIKEFIFEYDDNLVQKLLGGLKELKSKIESETVPQTLVDYPMNWQCSYCQYRAICDIAGPPELKWLEFKNKIQKSE